MPPSRNKEESFLVMVIVSALFHLFAFLFLLFLDYKKPETREFPNAIMVDLVNLPATPKVKSKQPVSKQITLSTTQPKKKKKLRKSEKVSTKQKEMEKNIQKEVKAKQKAKTKIHTEVKAKKETKTKANANAVDLSHKTQSTKEVVNPDKKIEEAIAHLKNQLAAKSQRTEAQPGIETYGYVGTKEGEKILNAKMQNYYRYISQKIKSSWAFPELVLASEDKNPLAILTVEIRRDGSVKDIQFEKKSGSEVFDNSVEKAVKKASPFPPLPYEYRGSTIEIGIRFTKDKF